MYAFDLQAKLKKLGKGLYLDVSQKATINCDNYSVAVYKSFGKRGERNRNDNLVCNDAQKYLDRVNSGQAEYLCGVTYPEVPEFDVFNQDTGTIVRRGWRSLALILVAKKICTLEEARKAFQVSSLGTTDYDRAGYERKLAWAKEN